MKSALLLLNQNKSYKRKVFIDDSIQPQRFITIKNHSNKLNIENKYGFNYVNSYKKANIIRICADNPFIEPGEINKLISFYKKKNYDYVCNRQVFSNVYSDGFGAEILSLNLLRKLDKLVKNKKLREHVTLYLWKNKKKFKIHSLKTNFRKVF